MPNIEPSLENQNEMNNLWARFRYFVKKIGSKIHQLPLIEIHEIYLVSTFPEHILNLAHPMPFDSEIEQDRLYLIDQNIRDLETVIEFAAVKTFLNFQYLNIGGIMKMVFLAWYASKHSRPKIQKYILEILEHSVKIFQDIYGVSPIHVKDQILFFMKSLKFESFYHEFLISQPPHGQDHAYYIALQTYLISHHINKIQDVFENIGQIVQNYDQQYRQSEIVPGLPLELENILFFSPFQFITSRFGLYRYLISIQNQKYMDLKPLFKSLPGVISFELYENGIITFSVLCNKDDIHSLKNLLDALISRKNIEQYQITEMGDYEFLFDKRSTRLPFPIQSYDITLVDFFLINRIIQSMLPALENEAQYNKYWSFNLKEEMSQLKIEFKQLLKTNPVKYAYLEKTLEVLKVQMQPEHLNDLHARFYHLKREHVIEFNPINIMLTISTYFSDTIAFMIQGEMEQLPPEIYEYVFGELDIYNRDGIIFMRRLFISKKKLLQFYYIIYRKHCDVIYNSHFAGAAVTDFIKYYDFSENKFVIQFPAISDIQNMIQKVELPRVNNQNQELCNSFLTTIPLSNLPIDPVEYQIYYSSPEKININRVQYLNLLEGFFLNGNPEIAQLSLNLERKVKRNKLRGDHQTGMKKPLTRFFVIFTSSRLNLNPILNFDAIKAFFLDFNAVTAIHYKGGLWNGLLILDFCDRDALDLKTLIKLAKSNILHYELHEIISEKRWMNPLFCYARDYGVKNGAYLIRYQKTNSIPPIPPLEAVRLYYPEYPILYHVAGFNMAYLLRFVYLTPAMEETIHRVFQLFSLGKLFKTATNSILIIIYCDYSFQYRANLEKFLALYKLTPRIDSILNLLEIDRNHVFFSKINQEENREQRGRPKKKIRSKYKIKKL